MNRIARSSFAAAALCAALAAVPPAQAADGRTGALLGGVAVGAVGGVLLGQALANHPAPPPQRYVEPAPVAYDPYFDELRHLHMGCDRGSRRACIAFGEFIGMHKEREDMWRHTYPEFFAWDGY